MNNTIGQLYPVFIKLPVENIVLLKSILETYEGIGVIRTLNKEKGEIVILGVEETKEELEGLLESLKKEFEFYITQSPESICEDWLLSEESIN